MEADLGVASPFRNVAAVSNVAYVSNGIM